MKKLIITFTVFSIFFISNTIAQNCNNMNLILDVDFNNYSSNVSYNINKANNDFGQITARTSSEIRGLDGNGTTWDHKARIINKQLRAEYLPNAASGRNGGFLFDRSFTGTEEAMLEYRVRFDNNFVWATGGKLPGLGGATTAEGGLPAGCTTNSSIVDNAFSLRLMWRRNRAQTQAPYLILYDYLPGRTSRCGGEEAIIRNIEKNKWYTIRQYVKLNTAGSNNGIIKIWINGDLLLDKDNVELRLPGKSNVKINALVAHTYRGGNATDPVWWSPTLDYAYFDDFKIWTCGGGGGNDELSALSAPGSVTQGSTVSVELDYSASTNRDVYAILQLGQSPWTTYASQKIDVSAGSGSLTFNLDVPSNLPLGSDKYQFQTFLTTNGGNWDQRLDNIAKTNVDAISSGSSSDLSEGVYRFQCVGAGNRSMDSDGVSIKLKDWTNASDQKWGLHETSGGYYNIDSEFSGRGVLDTDPNSVVKGTNTQPTNFSDGFEWKPIKLSNGNYRFENRINGRKYLRYNGTNFTVGYSDNADSRSEWKLTRLGSLGRQGLSSETTFIQSEIELFPNPMSGDYLNITGIENQSVTIQIMNLEGKKLMSLPEVRSSRIDISSLIPGTYNVIISDGTKLYSQMLIRQ